MLNEFKSGHTQYEIGKKYGISAERVRQILLPFGNIVGGISIKKEKRKKLRERFILKRKSDRIFRSYKCSMAEYNDIMGGAKYTQGSIANVYWKQKRNAQSRGIKFCLTLPEWWQIWQESGNFQNRGIGSNRYVMSRHGDSGPYKIGNVSIILASKNSSDAWGYKHWGRKIRKFYKNKS